MSSPSTTSLRLTLLAAVVTLIAGPASVSAQSDLDAAEAQTFLGDWVMTLETDLGVMDLDLQIEDMMGKVGARIGAPDLGGMQDITDITREGESLLLAYDLDMQGQVIDVAVTLEPDGENLAATVEAAGGQYVMSTVASRAAG